MPSLAHSAPWRGAWRARRQSLAQWLDGALGSGSDGRTQLARVGSPRKMNAGKSTLGRTSEDDEVRPARAWVVVGATRQRVSLPAAGGGEVQLTYQLLPLCAGRVPLPELELWALDDGPGDEADDGARRPARHLGAR